MKTVVKHKWLIVILTLASLLRLYDLAGNRPHLTNDEAAIGYNAYSVLQTTRDEHGERLPVVFKSFGDWKPGFYIYTAVPFIAVGGLNEYAVRLPSAVAGIFAVFLIYRIIIKLYPDRRKLAEISALFLAINPWHIHFSRGAWEANLSLTLLLAAILFFLQSFKKNYMLLFSSLFFALTLWTYQSAKMASLFVILILLFVYRKEFVSIDKKKILLSGVIGIVVSMPILSSLLTGKGGRLEVMSVFSYTRPVEYIAETIYSQSQTDSNNLFFSTFHSEAFNLTRGVFGRYFNHFSGRFLFFEGDWSNPKHSSPNAGYFILPDLILLLSGLYFVFRSKIGKSEKFVLLWLVTAPLASALSRDSVHGVRALNMVIPLTFLVSYGAFRTRKIIMLAAIPVYLFLYAFYLDAYWVHGKVSTAADYLYGYKQVVEKTLPQYDNYEKIVMKQSYDQPYIYYLFHGLYDPKQFQSTNNFVNSERGDVGQLSSLGNIEFRNINWSTDKKIKNTLFIGREIDFPMYELEGNSDYKYEVVSYPNGDPAFIVMEVLNTNED